MIRSLRGYEQKTKLYFSALDTAVKVASSKKKAISNIRLVNDRFGVYLPSYLYRIASQMDSADRYKKVANFILDAEQCHGSKLTHKRLIALGKTFQAYLICSLAVSPPSERKSYV